MWAIKGTPKDIYDKMTGEVTKALASSDIQARWATLGSTVPSMSRSELASFAVRPTSEGKHNVISAALWRG